MDLSNPFNFNRIVRILMPLTVILLVASSSAFAATYYVAKGGNDNNSGTEAAPWVTIQKAANTAVAGDKVYVKNGTYNEQVTFKNSGSFGKPIVLQNYPRHNPIIDGTGVGISGYEGLVQASGKNYITVDGFEIRNSSQCIVKFKGNSASSHVSGIIVRNCNIHTITTNSDLVGMFFVYVDNSFIEDNEIFHTRPGYNSNGISMESSSNNTIQNNFIHDFDSHNCVDIKPKTSDTRVYLNGNKVLNNVISGCKGGGIYIRYQTNMEIKNNLISDITNHGIWFDKDYNASPPVYNSNTLIENNTIAGNGGNGIYTLKANALTIKNNIFSKNNNANIYVSSEAKQGHVMDYNMYVTPSKWAWSGSTTSSFDVWKSSSGQDGHSSTGDLPFADYLNGDYSLLPNSDLCSDGEGGTYVGAFPCEDEPIVDLESPVAPLGLVIQGKKVN